MQWFFILLLKHLICQRFAQKIQLLTGSFFSNRDDIVSMVWKEPGLDHDTHALLGVKRRRMPPDTREVLPSPSLYEGVQ